MITDIHKSSAVILWQKDIDSGVGEPALLITPFHTVITIENEECTINVNYDSINELIKVLKMMKARNPELKK